jgi:hypothetical protein
MNVPHEYKARSIREAPDELLQVDLTGLNGSPRHFTGGPLLNALLLSVGINSHAPTQAVPTEEDLPVLHEHMMRTTGISDSIYELVGELNKKTILQYTLHRIASWKQLKLALAEGLSPMVGGSVYDSFLKAETTGVVPMPKPGEGLLGGHIASLISFDPAGDIAVAFANLGPQFGHKGKIKLRGSYIRNLSISSDFFVLVPGSVEYAH